MADLALVSSSWKLSGAAPDGAAADLRGNTTCRDLDAPRELAHALPTLGASTDGDRSAMTAASSEAM